MQTQNFIGLNDPEQQAVADAIIRACVHCGFCNAVCPTYQLLGDERDGPRGRIYLMKQALETGTASPVTQQHLDRCLTCRACETVCPSGVRYGELLDIGRVVVDNLAGRFWMRAAQRWLLTRIMPYPKRFTLLLWTAGFFKPLLPECWRKKLPVLAPAVSVSEGKARFKRRVLLLEGCVQPVLAPEINAALRSVLAHVGIETVTATNAGCCGALSYHLNHQEHGLNFMRSNIDAWLPYLDEGVEAIVSSASGCGLAVKEYVNYLRHDRDYRDKAERISNACKDIVEILSNEDLAKFSNRSIQRLAVQSPCTLQHGQRLAGSVEALLTKLGYELLPVANPHLCCGSAGTYSLLQSELSGQLLRNKVLALEAGQPECIVTANIGCLMHLRTEASVPVKHWIELLVAGRFD